MASFDYFIQPQGPQINVSLFQDAAQAGINSAKGLPSTTSAIIKGVQEGTDLGLDLTRKAQDVEIKQHQIEQQPIEDQIRQQQLENYKLDTELKKVEVAIDTNTQAEQLDAKKQELLNISSKASEERKVRARADEFFDTFQKADAAGKKELIFSGQYNDVFAKSPKTFEQGAIAVLSNPDLTPEERNALMSGIKRASTVNYYDRLAEQNRDAAEKAWSLAANDSVTDEVANKTDLTPDEVVQQAEFVIPGHWKTDANGKILKGGNGEYLVNNDVRTAPDPTAKPAAYAIKVGDRIVVPGGVDPKTKAQYEKAQSLKKYQDGTYKDRALQKVEKQEKPDGTQNLAANAAAQAQSQKVFSVKELAMAKFGFSPSGYEAVANYVVGLDEQAKRYAKDSVYRNSEDFVRGQSVYKKELVRSILGAQYDESPSIQAQFTDSEAKAYNAGIESQMARPTNGIVALNPLMASQLDRAMEPYKPRNGKELYYTRNYPIVEAQVSNLFTELVNYYDQKQQTVARATQADKNQLDFVTAARKGAPNGGSSSQW